jgi:hypothetical protein
MGAFLLAVAAALFFGYRAVHRWRDRPPDEPIRAWMNIPHIARSYRVPPDVLFQALGLPPKAQDRRPLTVIAREQNRSPDEVITLLQAAIDKERSSRPPPHPPPSGQTPEVRP